MVGDHPAHRGERGFQHRHIEEIALGARGVRQRRRDGEGRRDAADGVGDRIAHAVRRGFGVAGDAHHARHALDDLVVGGQVRERAVLAEARDRAVDQARIHSLQVFMAKVEPLHHAGPEVLDQHIGAGHELAEDLLAARVLEVERDRALARVLGEE
ncbi:hypothetical protein D3C87_1451880 [compost metagenome]